MRLRADDILDGEMDIEIRICVYFECSLQLS